MKKHTLTKPYKNMVVDWWVITLMMVKEHKRLLLGKDVKDIKQWLRLLKQGTKAASLFKVILALCLWLRVWHHVPSLVTFWPIRLPDSLHVHFLFFISSSNDHSGIQWRSQNFNSGGARFIIILYILHNFN